MRNAFLPPPDDSECVGWPDPSSTQLQDYCTRVEVGQWISLCEYKDGNYYYSITLQADETPLVVCALDHFITDNLNAEAGRRCDYLCMGWYNGECFIAFIELRKVIPIIAIPHKILPEGQTTWTCLLKQAVPSTRQN